MGYMMTTQNVFKSVMGDLKSLRQVFDTWGVEKIIPVEEGMDFYGIDLVHEGGVLLRVNNINFKGFMAVLKLEDGRYYIVFGEIENNAFKKDLDPNSQAFVYFDDLHLTIAKFLAKIRPVI